ncbi:MAG: cob(I)yrinic acid a,c-diamide adenosyltransferase [Actinomycetota bacterium]|jgi:cob(I)alamin adenosyltransferase
MNADSTEPLTESPIPEGGRSADSLVLVNTGNGKGKSSAAFGVMVRAIARDWKVAVVQFVKSSEWKVGEEKVGRQLGVDWRARGGGFTWDSANLQHDIDLAQAAWNEADEIISSGDYDLVILDELTYLCSWGWVPTADVVKTIENRPRHVNVVITGRDAPQEFIDVADTVTEMRHVKHAYDMGILAKRGIDY